MEEKKLFLSFSLICRDSAIVSSYYIFTIFLLSVETGTGTAKLQSVGRSIQIVSLALAMSEFPILSPCSRIIFRDILVSIHFQLSTSTLVASQDAKMRNKSRT